MKLDPRVNNVFSERDEKRQRGTTGRGRLQERAMPFHLTLGGY
jgi:hypothetical protein